MISLATPIVLQGMAPTAEMKSAANPSHPQRVLMKVVLRISQWENPATFPWVNNGLTNVLVCYNAIKVTDSTKMQTEVKEMYETNASIEDMIKDSWNGDLHTFYRWRKINLSIWVIAQKKKQTCVHFYLVRTVTGCVLEASGVLRHWTNYVV